MIEVKNITRRYGERAAVENLSFKVRKGSVHGFLGPNGAGKTTTMKMLAALMPPHSGQILVDGLDTVQNPMQVKKKIGLLLESPPLFLDMETREYLEFAAKLRGLPKAKVSEAVDEVLEVLGLASVERRLLGNLSKGYRQKVGVAQAIVHQPEVVILDEPTSGLDPKAVMEMRELIRGLKDKHTVLFSSHLLKEADLVCDDVTIISHGKLLASAPKEEIGKSLEKTALVKAVVARASEESLDKLRQLEFVSSVVRESAGEGLLLNIYLDALDDQREQISELLVNEKMGLLELTRERPDLEKIFLEVTAGGAS